MFNLLAISLVVVGICLLVSALIPVVQLIKQLPHAPLRHRWYELAALIVLFVAGYCGYIPVFWERHPDWPALIVPAIFFFGAGFVRLTAVLSLQTAVDMRRLILLEQESITDPLLGIYNRRYLDRRLSEETAGVGRSGRPLSVLLLDIDHFKCINDAYGHQVGDQVLISLSELTRHVKREADIAVRYGGDELLIIAPDTTVTSAVTLAERLRRQVEDYVHMVGADLEQQELRFTVSIGVASLCPEAAGYQKLLADADEALYRAKYGGRNRVDIVGCGDTEAL